MPRRGQKSLRVQLTDEDLDRTARALVEALPSAILTIERDEEPQSIASILGRIGGTDRERRTRVAVALAGTGDKSSRAYKSARRRIERYTTKGAERRRPSKESVRKIAHALRVPHLSTRTPLLVSMVADVVYQGNRKAMPAGDRQYVAPKRLETVRARLRAGDERGAAHALLDAFAYVYGLTSQSGIGVVDQLIGNIEEITITAEEDEG